MLIPGSTQSFSPHFSGAGSGNLPMQTPGLCWTVRFHVVGVDAKRETETERGNQTEMQRETGSQRQEPVGLQACTGCDADQNEGVSEGWEGAGTGGVPTGTEHKVT